MTDDQRRTIFDAENEAFRDHWGHREMTEGDYATTFDAPARHDLWVVAWDGDQVAGVVQNWIWPEENARLGVQARLARTHQRPPSVAASRPGPGHHRRRLVRLRGAGIDDAMLGVDAENPNGALGLYEGLGFVVDSASARTGGRSRAKLAASLSGGRVPSARGRRCRACRPRVGRSHRSCRTP